MLNIPKITLKYLELKLESSKRFYDEMIRKFQENKSILEGKYKEEEVGEEAYDELLDSLIDDYYEQNEFENLAGMLVISHNYFVFEHILRSLTGHLQKQGKIAFKGDYRKMKMWKIKESFKKIDIDFDEIEGFSDCNILGLIVNSIKHNGTFVSKELARAKGNYKVGEKIKEEIKIMPEEIDKCSGAINLFCNGLVREINNKTKE